MATINRHAANGGGIHFFGVEQLDEKGLAKLWTMAPVAAVHKGMPPFLCIHGTKDDQVAYEQTTGFCDAMHKAGARQVYLAVTHGLLVGSAIEKIQRAPVNRLFITDTIPLPAEKAIPKISVLSVAPLLGEAIKRIHRNESVSKLFE